MFKQVLLVVVFAVLTFFASLELLGYAVRVPTPSFLHHPDTLVLALAYPYVVLAIILGVGLGAPLGYLLKKNVLRGSLIAILPVPILYALFGPWPQNKWINVIGYSVIVLAYCGSAYLAHRLTTRSKTDAHGAPLNASVS